MTPGAEYLKTSDTARDAAERLAANDIGVVPVCDADGHLVGMVTDRDIVVKVVAEGENPNEASLGQITDRSEVVTIGADDSVDELIAAMKEHQVRRLPVIDGREVVGIVSQGDLARTMPSEKVGELLAALSS
jgi:CBS domain-containing protein